MNGYTLISQPRHCTSRGGLIIFLLDKFNYTCKLRLKYDTWEGQFINVKKGDHLSKPITIGNIYRRPLDLVENYTQFIHEISPHLANMESGNTDVVIAGDYNIDLLKINDKPVISEYFDMLTSHSFFPKITLPTRLTNNNGTLIDNFLCKLTDCTLDTTSGVLLNKFSDHQPYFTVLNNLTSKHHIPHYVKITKNDKESINNFHRALATSNSLQSLDNTNTNDPNINFAILQESIQNAKNIHLPEKYVKFDKHKHKKSNWITSSIIKSIAFRDNLYKKYRRTDPNSPQYQAIKTNLNTFNNILRTTIRLTKKTYYEALFKKYKGDMKSTWKTINTILSRTKRKKKFPQYFKDGNNIITGKAAIANHFNSFFTNIGPNLSRLIETPNKNFNTYLRNKINSNFKFQTVNTDIINSIIDKLAPKSSTGYDGISTKLIKTVKNTLLNPITIIVNQIFNWNISK